MIHLRRRVRQKHRGFVPRIRSACLVSMYTYSRNRNCIRKKESKEDGWIPRKRMACCCRNSLVFSEKTRREALRNTGYVCASVLGYFYFVAIRLQRQKPSGVDDITKKQRKKKKQTGTVVRSSFDSSSRRCAVYAKCGLCAPCEIASADVLFGKKKENGGKGFLG